MNAAAPYRSLRPTSRWAIRALVVTIALDVVIAVHNVVDARMLTREIEAPGTVTSDRLALSDSIVMTLASLQIALLIITAVAFLLWFRRAAANLPALGAVPRYSPGWTVGMWFVPFVNWVLPKRAANDAWRAGTNEEPPLRLNLWWFAWVVALILGRVVNNSAEDAETLADHRALAEVEIAAVAVDAAAAVLAILVIRAINRRQEQRYELGPIPSAPDRPELRSIPDSPPEVREDDEFVVPPAWGRPAETAGARFTRTDDEDAEELAPERPRFTRDDDRAPSPSGD
ncbi:MAG TPA: DUF4328 domain-containing protein [Solirubrobacteraceae bacterium]|nr:DUF4328 domain-containing protein [Solirubrobacteraceae bacterium]